MRCLTVSSADDRPALTWLPVALIFEQNVCSFAVITGGSMQVGSGRSVAEPQPTLNPDTTASHCDVVLLDRLSLGLSRLRRGDVVTFWWVGLGPLA